MPELDLIARLHRLAAGSAEGLAVPLMDTAREALERIAALTAERDRLAGALEPSARDIVAERRRQIEGEGWTPAHDHDEHGGGELALAAATYAVPAYWRWDGKFVRHLLWPWEREWLKPGKRRRELVKAGALILAEIDRLDGSALNPTKSEKSDGN